MTESVPATGVTVNAVLPDGRSARSGGRSDLGPRLADRSEQVLRPVGHVRDVGRGAQLGNGDPPGLQRSKTISRLVRLVLLNIFDDRSNVLFVASIAQDPIERALKTAT